MHGALIFRLVNEATARAMISPGIAQLRSISVDSGRSNGGVVNLGHKFNRAADVGILSTARLVNTMSPRRVE